jgi:enterochelin esterase-like enzyme
MIARDLKINWFHTLASILFLYITVTACESKVSSAKTLGEQIPTGPTFIESHATKTPPYLIESGQGTPSTFSSQVPTPRQTAQPSENGSSTPRSCMAAGGRIETTRLLTPLLTLPMEVRVYLPPCYHEEADVDKPQQSYPVLYLIHGQSYTDDQWDRLGADDIASELIASGEIRSFLIVMPRERIWKDPDENMFGQAVVEDLIPWVDKTYHTIPDRQHRAIGGLSRGGAWAVHLGFSHWELFGAISGHSAFYFNSDAHNIRTWLKAIPPESMPRIFLDIGDRDYLDVPNRKLEDLLVEYSIPHEWYLFPGRHDEVYWERHVEQYIRWYAADW